MKDIIFMIGCFLVSVGIIGLVIVKKNEAKQTQLIKIEQEIK